MGESICLVGPDSGVLGEVGIRKCEGGGPGGGAKECSLLTAPGVRGDVWGKGRWPGGEGNGLLCLGDCVAYCVVDCITGWMKLFEPFGESCAILGRWDDEPA